jgi:hypothetical protein
VEKTQSNRLGMIKKLYTPPKIETYGNLRSVTENTSNTPRNPDPPPHGSGNYRS